MGRMAELHYELSLLDDQFPYCELEDEETNCLIIKDIDEEPIDAVELIDGLRRQTKLPPLE